MMRKKIIATEKAPAAIGPYSQAVVAGEFIFTAGQIPLDPSTGTLVQGDIQAQTKRVFENLKAVLEAGGSSMKDIVKATVYLVSMDDFTALNEVYSEYLGETKPARSTVAVSALPRGARVEIEAIATVRA